MLRKRFINSIAQYNGENNEKTASRIPKYLIGLSIRLAVISNALCNRLCNHV
jgi:hypothetical protein